MWNQAEWGAIHDMLTTHNALKSALAKFTHARAEARNQDCAMAMRSVPRQWEVAADYAAKAEVYEGLLAELEHECEKFTTGPTS